jgi:hypothetical protein
MGALKHTIKVAEIPGEPMRYRVESWQRPKYPYTVDLSEAGGHGECHCKDFCTTVTRNRKLHPGAWIDYGTPDDINPDRTQCKHIAVAQKKWKMTVLPDVAARLNAERASSCYTPPKQ